MRARVVISTALLFIFFTTTAYAGGSSSTSFQNVGLTGPETEEVLNGAAKNQTDLVNVSSGQIGDNLRLLLQVLEVCGVLGATYFAARSAKYAHQSLIQQRKNEEPKIVVFVRQSNNSLNVIDLIIRNEGARSARDIKFQIIGTNIGALTNRKIKDIGLVKNGIAILAGGQEIAQPLGVMLGDSYKEYKKANTKVKVTYGKGDGYQKQETFLLDFKGLIDRKLGESDLESIAKSLGNIQSELHTIKKDIHLVANKGITEIFPQPVPTSEHDVTEELE